jgi:CRISPR-associated endonuclease/helicase Cas3
MTGLSSPREWQTSLANESGCDNRLIRIPTGFGKTFGVLAAWIYNRIHRNSDQWPRRLVWCLPMRVLVEQTHNEVKEALSRLGLLWSAKDDHAGKVGVHVLMGGADSARWHLYPEHAAVLIGTQDMLLSRALNRGYASPRARWPMEFGLLNHDCLWVMDEVQLMDVGLATSGQLQIFRESDSQQRRSFRPCKTWWMSATLQREWLGKSPDTKEMAAEISLDKLQSEDCRGPLWDEVSKPCRVAKCEDNPKSVIQLIRDSHLGAGRGERGPTLVVVNRVERATSIFDGLKEDRELKGTNLYLVHSRFRPQERAAWSESFLNRQVCKPGSDCIIVATQVVEAGVDFSASLLITELAPWPSLVQRFGRAARWGGTATVMVLDFEPEDEKKAAPYSKDELDAAREAFAFLEDVAPRHLECFERQHPEVLARLYPYEPRHLLLRHEFDELFDTTPDLSGADVDVSRFIRSGDERDLQVFWAEVPPKSGPDVKVRPDRDALCSVPFLKARDWLCGKEGGAKKAPRLKKGMRAWVWDWLNGRWRIAERKDLYPGQVVLVDAACGGYTVDRGWSPESTKKVSVVEPVAAEGTEESDATEDDESLSQYPWQTIAVHGRETGKEARSIASSLVPELADLLDLGGRWHDAGKVHPAFNNSIVGSDRPARNDLAKAPKRAWLPKSRLYPMVDGRRRGFRHELASTLALFAVLQRHKPEHEALLGPWYELLEKTGKAPDLRPTSDSPPTELESEILSLGAQQFNLLAYLICCHHGKVRVAWHASPADQAAGDEKLRIRGIREGDTLPKLLVATASDGLCELPETVLDLSPAAAGINARTGASWTERVLSLMELYGPFSLAWLEAILRAADQRASQRNVQDELLNPEGT